MKFGRVAIVALVAFAAEVGIAHVDRGTAAHTSAARTSAGQAVRTVNVGGVDQGIVDIDTRLKYQSARAAGTGMVLTADGIVLTNNHVIRGATTISVYVPSSGRRYSASVLGYSVTHDVAVLRLKSASGLDTVAVGESSGVKVGDAVTAVGNAGGVGGKPSSVTGKVTGLGRAITASDDSGSTERLTGLIETSAAIEPGDSGGALLDASGEVIGMNTAASRGFQFQDMPSGASQAYAITIDHALDLAHQIIAGQPSTIVHVGDTPFLGIQVQQGGYYSLNPGLLVAQVVPSSPADRSGIQAGDTITSLNGKALSSPKALTALLLTKKPGMSVRLNVVDQFGHTETATLTLASGPPQ